MKNLFSKTLQGVYKSLALWGIIFYITTSIPSFSQQIHTVTPIPKINKNFLIVAHIVASDSTSFESLQPTITEQISTMNAFFEPIGVSFSVCEFRLIDNPRYKVPSMAVRKEMTKLYKKDNRINMFFLDSFEDPAWAAGIASLGGISMTGDVGIYIAVQKQGLTVSVLAHEMGHFFGLSHTFGGAESVDGNNCLVEADGICDTPADPYVRNSGITYLNDDCVFIATVKDANDQYYSPLVDNIMSYYQSCECGSFTDGQFKKMVETYSQPYNPSTVIKFVW